MLFIERSQKEATMGRPIKFDREEALDAAMNYFWANGFERTSVSDLAEVMGITRSSFYNSFGSKDDVFKESLARYSEASPDRHFADVSTGDRILPLIEKGMRDLCSERTSDTQARGCLIVNCLNEAPNTEAKAPGIGKLFSEKVKHLQLLLQQAKDQHEIDQEADIVTLASETFAFLCGLNLASKFIREEHALWAMCKSFLDAHKLSVRNPLIDLDLD